MVIEYSDFSDYFNYHRMERSNLYNDEKKNVEEICADIIRFCFAGGYCTNVNMSNETKGDFVNTNFIFDFKDVDDIIYRKIYNIHSVLESYNEEHCNEGEFYLNGHAYQFSTMKDKNVLTFTIYDFVNVRYINKLLFSYKEDDFIIENKEYVDKKIKSFRNQYDYDTDELPSVPVETSADNGVEKVSENASNTVLKASDIFEDEPVDIFANKRKKSSVEQKEDNVFEQFKKFKVKSAEKQKKTLDQWDIN